MGRGVGSNQGGRRRIQQRPGGCCERLRRCARQRTCSIFLFSLLRFLSFTFFPRSSLALRLRVTPTTGDSFIMARLIVSCSHGAMMRILTMQYIPCDVLAKTNSSIRLLQVRHVKQ